MAKLCPKVLPNALLLHHQIHYQGKWELAPQTTIQRIDQTSCGTNNSSEATFINKLGRATFDLAME